MPDNGSAFNATIPLLFYAFDKNEADAMLEEILDYLYNEGFEIEEEEVILEESVIGD